MLTLVRGQRRSQSIVRWTSAFFRSYRGRVALLGSLSLAEIALRAFAPWPLKAIVDHLVGGHATSLPILSRLEGPDHRAALLLSIVAIGFVLQLGHELVLLAHTRVQARLAQRMVFDLRSDRKSTRLNS